jgi:DNA polymerase
MFGVDINTIVKGRENFKYRALGKIGELALGFGGGRVALLNMAKTLNMTLDVDPDLIKELWRKESPRIVKMWKDLENCARTAIQNPGALYDTGYQGVTMCMYNGVLQIRLPSGRILCYAGAHLVGKVTIYGKYVLEIKYYGINDKGQWAILTTYGGKITENIVQAIARDCLVEKMILIEDNGFPIVLHVHDEIGVEIPKYSGYENTLHHLMSLPIPWAPGLPLSASADVLQFYMKTD